MLGVDWHMDINPYLESSVGSPLPLPHPSFYEFNHLVGEEGQGSYWLFIRLLVMLILHSAKLSQNYNVITIVMGGGGL